MRSTLVQSARYFIAAGAVALFYLGVFALGLTIGLHYFAAILLAQVMAVTAAFPVYRVFVFRSRGRVWPDFVRFLSVWVSGAIAGIVVTPLLVELGGVHPLVAQIGAIVLVGIGSFLAHRIFSFRAVALSKSEPDTRTLNPERHE